MANRAKQFEFNDPLFKKPGDVFGGSQLKSHPKVKRPIASKLPLHLVLRANQSSFRLPATYKVVNQTVRVIAKKHGVRIYKYSNNGNHLHVLLKLSRIHRWSPFIRELTSQIVQKLRELGVTFKVEKLWMGRPFTRIVRGWKKAFKTVKEYLYLNELEAEGRISRNEIRNLKDLRTLLDDG